MGMAMPQELCVAVALGDKAEMGEARVRRAAEESGLAVARDEQEGEQAPRWRLTPCASAKAQLAAACLVYWRLAHEEGERVGVSVSRCRRYSPRDVCYSPD